MGMGISGIGHQHGGGIQRAVKGAAGDDTDVVEAKHATGGKHATGAPGGGEGIEPGRNRHVHGHSGRRAQGPEGVEAGGRAHGAKDADDADGADEVDDADGADETKEARGGGRGTRAGGAGGGCDRAGGGDDAEVGDAAAAGADAGAIALKAPTAAGTGELAADVATGGVASLIGASTGADIFAKAAAAVPNSALAAQVFSAIQSSGAQVNVLSDADFATKYGRASGVFDPNTNQISVPTSVAIDPAKSALILLHEGVHWLQHNTQGGIDAAGGAITQALQGANANSTATSTKGKQQQDEAQAYLLEALAANQSGTADQGMGTTTSGRVATYAQIVGSVQATPEYA